MSKTIRLVKADTIYAAILAGIKSNTIIPFALALKASNHYIALIASVPDLVGSLFQLFVIDLMRTVKNSRQIIYIATLIDAILWLPLLLIPFLWPGNIILLLNILILRAIAVELLRPFYNNLLSEIIPESKRGKYLAQINRITEIVSFISTIGAGIVITLLQPFNHFIGFSVVFFVGFLARLVCFQLRFKFPNIKITNMRTQSLFKIGKNFKTNYGKFVMYEGLIMLALGICTPFFPVYMLTVLKLNFLTYSIITSASIISSSIVLNRWGRTIDRKGSKWMITISGFLIPVVPLLWIFFKSPFILILVQFFSGAVWSAFTLSTTNFVMDATYKKNRLTLMSFRNFFNGIMTFFGAITGAYLLTKTSFFSLDKFYFVFALSAVLRFIFGLMFIPKIRDERYIDIELKGPKARRIISILPSHGLRYRFIPRKK